MKSKSFLGLIFVFVLIVILWSCDWNPSADDPVAMSTSTLFETSTTDSLMTSTTDSSMTSTFESATSTVSETTTSSTTYTFNTEECFWVDPTLFKDPYLHDYFEQGTHRCFLGNELSLKGEVFRTPSYKISDLTGMEQFANSKLTKLSIEVTFISDISPLSSLVELRYLNLSSNKITQVDLSSVNTFPHLETLNLYSNHITDLKLSNMPKLSSIIFDDNPIKALELSNLPNLKKLDLWYSENVELSEITLSNLPNFTGVYLRNQQNLTKIVFKNLPLLSSLYISSCSLSDLSMIPLDQFPSLKELHLSNNRLTEAHLTNLPVVTSINLSQNQLASLKLEYFPTLQSLDISNNPLTELYLTDLPAVTFINLSQNQLASLKLENFPTLQSLDISNNSLIEVYLTDLPAVSSMNLSQNHLTSLNIVNTPLLETLDLSHNSLASMPSFTVMTKHLILDIEGNTDLPCDDIYNFINESPFTPIVYPLDMCPAILTPCVLPGPVDFDMLMLETVLPDLQDSLFRRTISYTRPWDKEVPVSIIGYDYIVTDNTGMVIFKHFLDAYYGSLYCGSNIHGEKKEEVLNEKGYIDYAYYEDYLIIESGEQCLLSTTDIKYTYDENNNIIIKNYYITDYDIELVGFYDIETDEWISYYQSCAYNSSTINVCEFHYSFDCFHPTP